MIITDIPESVYREAAIQINPKASSTEYWTWKQEYSLLVSRQGFTNLELEKAISDYLLLNGEWEG